MSPKRWEKPQRPAGDLLVVHLVRAAETLLVLVRAVDTTGAAFREYERARQRLKGLCRQAREKHGISRVRGGLKGPRGRGHGSG